MAFISAELNRVIGVLVSRNGKVNSVIVGDAERLFLPDIGRVRGGAKRFRGLRLIRTVLKTGKIGYTGLYILYLSRRPV